MNPNKMNDTRVAALIFAIATALLTLFAAVDLNNWPGQQFISLLTQPSARSFVGMVQSYALIVAGLFWGSKPSFQAQRFLLLAWPIATYCAWLLIQPGLSIDWADNAELVLAGLLSIGMGFPALCALVWRVSRPALNSNADFERNLRWLLLFIFLFSLVPTSALQFTVSLHSETFDVYALKFDASGGWNLTPWLIEAVDAIPGASALIRLAYSLTPLGLLAVSILQLRGKRVHVPNALLLWVVMTVCALIAYHFFPVTGPKYVFGSEEFLARLRVPSKQPLEMVAGVGPNPRNGMPSMHFGWMLAASILWMQSQTNRWSRVVLVAMTVCVAIATLYLGEHYVIDLIVAVPFTLSTIALTTTGVSFERPERWRTVLLGFGCWLTWVLLLRNQITFFLDHSWACWLLTGATVLVVVLQARAMTRFRVLANDGIVVDCGDAVEPSSLVTQRLSRRMGAMFFASGVAALIYQVLFAKELALVFGSTATATFTVLATFLGGMAIGSLIGGVMAPRVARPIVVYAFVELAIAVFCTLTPALFAALQGAYVFLAADMPPASPMLVVLRVALGAGVLLVPTVLMGMTLPLLAQAVNPSGKHLGSSVAWLYACNTAGAALGAIVTSYFVIPALGVRSTTLIAAVMNLLVALGALELAKAYGALPAPTSAPTAALNVSGASITKPGSRGVLLGALAALGLGGVLSLGLEVVYVHMLSIVAGNSVYAFGLMLATFLVGLALGGEGGRRLLQGNATDRVALLALSQLGLAASVAFGAWGWDLIPAYFASFAGYPIVTSFQSREAVRALVCALVMIPPTVCIGMSYTLAMDIATTSSRYRSITMLGWSAALNTLGNIAGVLLFGFVLLPWLGGLITGKVVALSAVLLSAVVLATMTASPARRWMVTALVAVTALVIASPTRLNYEVLSSGANVYFAAQNWGEVIDRAESIDGGLTTVARRGNTAGVVTTLLTNGKFQGNDVRKGEVQAQIGFAALPLLHQAQRDNALVIGYGTGATSRVFYDAGFQHMDIAELSGDVVHLADTYFENINSRVSGLPGVKTHVTDGRNFLLLTRRQYDVISIEISSIWFAGAASLYNREFYRLARSKLRHDGVMQQWVQLHHMTSSDLLTIIGTLRAEFAYVSLYVAGGQGVLIATNDQGKSRSTPAAIATLDNSPRLQAVRDLAGRTFADMANDLLLAPTQVDGLLARTGVNPNLWLSTDNNLRLEYSTPKANAAPPDQSLQINMKLLSSAREKV